GGWPIDFESNVAGFGQQQIGVDHPLYQAVDGSRLPVDPVTVEQQIVIQQVIDQALKGMGILVENADYVLLRLGQRAWNLFSQQRSEERRVGNGWRGRGRREAWRTE